MSRPPDRSPPPAFAVVDLRLDDGNGLDVVEVLRERRPDSRVVVLTGYGAIATAVAAVKIGATDYLSKPADATDITNALLAKGDDLPPPAPKATMPVLMFHGLNDTALLSGALNNTWDWLEKDLTLVTVPGAGHFVQQDASELVTTTMQWWIGR